METYNNLTEASAGLLPDEWQERDLGSVGIFSKGKGISRAESNSGNLPCVRYGEIYTHHHEYIRRFYSYINEELARSSSRIKQGDILFAGSGETKEEIGKCVAFLDDCEAYAGGDIVILSPNGVDSMFLGYLLNSENIQKQKSSKGQGDAVVHIHASHLTKIRIPLPPLSEQKAIAEVLSDIDNLIQSIEKQIEKKRLIKQGAIQKLFIPQPRWEKRRIKDVVSVPVTDGPHETPTFLRTGVPFLSVNNLIDNKIDWRDLRFISKEDDARFSLKCKPQRNDLLLGKAASVGKIAIVETNLDFNIWSPLALMRLKEEYFPKFLYYSFQTKSALNQIGFFTNSSSQGNIGMGEIEKLEFCFPSYVEQIQTATIFSDMDSAINGLQKKLVKTKLIKQGLMQNLLTGKIRLNMS